MIGERAILFGVESAKSSLESIHKLTRYVVTMGTTDEFIDNCKSEHELERMCTDGIDENIITTYDGKIQLPKQVEEQIDYAYSKQDKPFMDI